MIQTLGIQKVLWVKAREGVAASGKIPEDAEFFKDHFPGFPVLPGVLALEMLRQSAEFYFRNLGIEDAVLRIRKMTSVRFARYLRPGDLWESELSWKSESGNESVWLAKLYHQGEVAVSARLVLEMTRIPGQIII